MFMKLEEFLVFAKYIGDCAEQVNCNHYCCMGLCNIRSTQACFILPKINCSRMVNRWVFNKATLAKC